MDVFGAFLTETIGQTK